MLDNKIDKDICLKLLTHIIIPSLNYGAFMDDAST